MTDKVYTWQEVGKHNQPEDLWFVIGDYVYDVTKYSSEHAGGPIVLNSRAGRNASVAFQQACHSANAVQNVQPQYKIGKIDKESKPADWQKQAESASPNVLLTVAILIIILIGVYYVFM